MGSPKFNQIELKKLSTYLLENLSDCHVCAPEKFQVSLTGFEPMPSAMPVQCFFQLTMKPLGSSQLEKVNLLGLCVPVKGMTSEETLLSVNQIDN